MQLMKNTDSFLLEIVCLLNKYNKIFIVKGKIMRNIKINTQKTIDIEKYDEDIQKICNLCIL